MTKQPTKQSDAIGGIGSDAVLAATGKSWKQWCAALDKAGCKTMTHKEIVAVVHGKYGVGPWWQQMVTVGYEQARGLRKKHQKPGGFEISKSKTLAVPVAKVFAAWRTAESRSPWLGGHDLTVRKAVKNKVMRITWSKDGSNLDVQFYPKGPGKTQLTVQHGKLPSAKHAEKMKSAWGRSLTRLQLYLEQ